MDEYTFDGRSMNQNLELEASAGKKPIDLVFSKSMSGIEIIDPFCDPRDSDKNPISYPPKGRSIEFQRSRSLSKRILFIRREKGVLVADARLNESFHPATSKSGVWHSQRGKQGGIPLWKRKGRVLNEGLGLKGQPSRCPSVKSRGLVSAKSFLFSFDSFLAMNRKVRGGARS
ncbi:hypothetical protein RND71_026432 [Anisodus tanguticus]|uniref:Uncharacterized protein n=1 Tax=Anisodus tanguticus TaxID=243964 RepID=A0AAE1RM75_9SOLA|nr:hypothetical protein RND71_026432 [Anisodus tanguticus]